MLRWSAASIVRCGPPALRRRRGRPTIKLRPRLAWGAHGASHDRPMGVENEPEPATLSQLPVPSRTREASR